MYVFMYVCMYVCMYECMYVCMYVYMYVFTPPPKHKLLKLILMYLIHGASSRCTINKLLKLILIYSQLIIFYIPETPPPPKHKLLKLILMEFPNSPLHQRGRSRQVSAVQWCACSQRPEINFRWFQLKGWGVLFPVYVLQIKLHHLPPS